MNSEDAKISFSRKELSQLYMDLDQADCTFIFQGEEIKAHKLILACCSPVFEKMFFGKLASNRIVITDIPLEEFGQMLEFIYTNTVRFKSVLDAWSLFYIAHKYSLDSFADACVDYVQQNLTINNLVLNYEYAEMYGVEHLQSICLNEISCYIKGLFTKICDYHMKATSLVKILEQKTLNISNNELIIGVVNWAVIECDIKNISLSPENVVNLLKSLKILQHLIDLELGINPNFDILTKKVCHLVRSYKNPNVPFKNYSNNHWCIFCKCRQTYKIAGRVEMRGRDVLISNISVDRNSLLFGLVLVTENEQVGDSNDEYTGEIRIQINQFNNFEIMNDTVFRQTLLYDTSVYIPLSNVIYLEYGKTYSIKISYKNLDNLNTLGVKKSSVLCNYMSNKLVDEKKNVIFTFDELDGSVIRGISYYPV